MGSDSIVHNGITESKSGMTLLVNGTILNHEYPDGLSIYTQELLSELLPLLGRQRFFARIVIAGPHNALQQTPIRAIVDNLVEVRKLPPRGPVRRLIDLNRWVLSERKNGPVLFYSPTHHGVISRGIAQVITLHDLFPLIFPYNYRQQYYYFKYYLPRVLGHTGRVITDSQNSAADILSYLPDSPPRVVIPAALRSDLVNLEPQPVVELEGKRFFLLVGPSYAHKNVERLIESFDLITEEPVFQDYRLVFAGGREVYINHLRKLIAERFGHLTGRIDFLGHVSREELGWLYQQAVAGMVTTLYEGFGLPALEAMYFGCPVVVSQVASLPEVCGEAALYVDPNDTAAIASAMKRIATDQQLRQRLIELGQQNVKRFSWQRSARQVSDCLVATSQEWKA